MKRTFLAILILFCMQQAKGQIIWERIEAEPITISGGYHKAMLKDSLIFVYGSGQIGSNQFKVFYSCYNINGKLKWRRYGPTLLHYSERHGDVIIDTDSTLATNSFNNLTFNFDFQKIRMLTGDTLPASRFPVTPYSYVARNILSKNPDGSYLIAGAGGNFTTTKLNNNGNPTWTKNNFWGNPLYNVRLISDPRGYNRKDNGNYIILGRRSLPINPTHAVHPIFVEFDSNGDSIRSRTLILEDPLFYVRVGQNSLMKTRNGDFLFSGSIDTVVDNGLGFTAKTYLAMVDKDFNLKWKFIAKGAIQDYTIHRIAELADSSFALLAGGYDGANNNSFAVIKISKDGDYLSHVTYNNSNCNSLYRSGDWQILPDGSAIFAGYCKNKFTYVARIAGVGIPAVSGNSEDLKSSFTSSIEAFPNPAKENITFRYNLPQKTKQAEMRIYEIDTGKIVQQILVKPFGKEFQQTTKKLKSGMYAYTLLADGIPAITKKLVVVK